MARVALLRKQAPTFSVPSLADTSAEYAALVQKRDKLSAQRAKLETERSALMDEIAQTTISPQRRERDARVAMLLDDETVTSLSRPHDRLSVISQEIADIKVALDTLADQVRQARNRASTKILDDVRPEYARRVEACCEALLKLREASAAYVELTDELSLKDIAWLPLEPLPVSFAGAPHDRNSRTAIYLRGAAKSGYFSYDKIPVELR